MTVAPEPDSLEPSDRPFRNNNVSSPGRLPSQWTPGSDYKQHEQEGSHGLVSKDSNGSSNQASREHRLDPPPPNDVSASATAAEATWDFQPWPLVSTPNPSPEAPGKHSRARDKPSSGGESSHFQASLTDRWPQRSPIQTSHEQEVTSFSLFAQSFDTLSATEHFPSSSPPSQRKIHSPTVEDVKHQPPRRIDFVNRESEVGDISPIKLEEHRQKTPVQKYRHHNYDRHRSSSSRPDYPPPALPARQSAEYTPAVQYGYRGDISWRTEYAANGYSTTASNPFFVLRNAHQAFETCSYKLSALLDHDICHVNLSQHHSTFRRYHDASTSSPDNEDVKIAQRRVASAIHAFGGYIQSNEKRSTQSSSIFRDRKTPAKEFYDYHFHQRYMMMGNRISWDLEENPPILDESTEDRNGRNAKMGPYHGNVESDEDGTFQNSMNDMGSPQSNGSVVPLDSQQKMRYRCKLCGQLKQNHNCPYQQSLQRSIAVMVLPVVNAFTANEPGILTKPLSEMNNFVMYDCDNQPASSDHFHHVTPEAKARTVHQSPESAVSVHSRNDPSPNRGQKRGYSQVDAATPPSSGTPGVVAKTLTLRPEHYRAVTPRHKDKTLESGDYQYPHVPLTFHERKRLSDTLFSLSREIPGITAQVGSLLRMARETDDWDLAVSEVLTQIVVALYCGEGDHRLDGLQQYLLGIGISS